MKKYQQGDVIIREISGKKIDKENHKISRDDNKVVLALGEATGHHHRFELSENPAVVGYRNNSWSLKNTTAQTFEITEGTATLYHEEHNPIKIPKGHYEVNIVKEFDHITRNVRQVWD